jgi:hypothetical protein
MDNKQNRQFYWEVKDFLGKNNQSNSSKVSKPESLKECISKTIIKNDALYRPSIIRPAPLTEDIISSVNSLLSLNENHIKRNSNNITTNLFNLTEAPAPAFGGGSLSGGPGRSFDSSRRPESSSSWRDRNPEEYQQNVEMRLAKQREAEENRKKAVEDSNRRKAEDEAYEYGQAMKDAGSDAQLEMDSKRPGIAADTAANRAKLQNFRTTKDTERQASHYSDVIANAAKKDPSQLSAKEAAELAMAKIVMRGGGEGGLSKGNKDLEAKIQTKVGQKLGASPLSQEVDPTINQQQADIDALAKANMTPEQAAAGAAARTRAKNYFAGDTESSFKLSREKTAEDVKARAEQARIDAEKMKEDRYQSMKDKLVQGTNMTYGEFEAKTGRRFNATNAQDSSLISNLAGAGSRGRSETAKQLDLTTDQFNSRYAEQNKDLAQRQGTADRAVDQSQFESDKFKNDPAYRKQVRDAETAKLMPQVKAQIAADEAKRIASETAGREQARIAKDEITKTNLEKSKNFIPSLSAFSDKDKLAAKIDAMQGPNPDGGNASSKFLPPAEDFVSLKPEEENIIPYRSETAKIASDSEVRKQATYRQYAETQKRLDAEREKSNAENERKQRELSNPRNQPGLSSRLEGPPSPETQKIIDQDMADRAGLQSYRTQRDLEEPIRDLIGDDPLSKNDFMRNRNQAAAENLGSQAEYNEYVIQTQDAQKAARSRGVNPSTQEPVQSFDEWKKSKQKQASDAAFANQPRPEFTQNAPKAPNDYVSLINSFTAPKVGREPIAPGSKQDVDTQLKRLRGQ